MSRMCSCSEVCVEFVAVLEAVRIHYLFLYNLLQFLGFSWTFSLLTANLILQGQGQASPVIPTHCHCIHWDIIR